MTPLALIVYALVAAGVARAEADRRSTWGRSPWLAALTIGAVWPLAFVVAVAARGWKSAGEWL